jgi:hypothetical protein
MQYLWDKEHPLPIKVKSYTKCGHIPHNTVSNGGYSRPNS